MLSQKHHRRQIRWPMKDAFPSKCSAKSHLYIKKNMYSKQCFQFPLNAHHKFYIPYTIDFSGRSQFNPFNFIPITINPIDTFPQDGDEKFQFFYPENSELEFFNSNFKGTGKCNKWGEKSVYKIETQSSLIAMAVRIKKNTGFILHPKQRYYSAQELPKKKNTNLTRKMQIPFKYSDKLAPRHTNPENLQRQPTCNFKVN